MVATAATAATAAPATAATAATAATTSAAIAASCTAGAAPLTSSAAARLTALGAREEDLECELREAQGQAETVWAPNERIARRKGAVCRSRESCRIHRGRVYESGG